MNNKVTALSVLAMSIVASTSWANAPAGRYSITNGTVHDNRTGLTWQQSYRNKVVQADAATYCASQSGGWRLPTIKELLTLYDFSYSGADNVYLDSVAFGGVAYADSTFWSSTVSAGDRTSVWQVIFGQWIINVGLAPASSNGSARCVK